MERIIDDNVQVSKSIGFPLSLLAIIDTYCRLKGFSRTKIVIDALREYIKNHNVEKFINSSK
jgi:metal-responsive CopG/Arc/MetJ family transcriptional regulator